MTTPIRVGQVIQSVEVRAGGTSSAFLNILGALRTRPGVALRAYAAPPDDGGPACEDIRANPAQWTTVGGYGRLLGAGSFGRSVIADVRAGTIDLLHLHGLWSPDLLGIAKECLRAGMPYVWEPHGMLVREAFAQKRWKKEVFMAAGMRRALAGAAEIVFVTADERDHSLDPTMGGADKRTVVPLPVGMPGMPITPELREKARARFGVPADVPAVVFMGRFHPVKRIDMAVRALARLSGPLGQTRLLLIGGGEEEGNIRDLAQSLGVAPRVVHGGWVQGDDKWLALAAGDVLTLNSVHENFGYVAVEAMCVGTMPVLTSNLALAAECAAAGVAVAAQPDEASLAAAWAGALGERDWPATLARGSAWVRERLSPEVIGATLEALYRRTLERTVRGVPC